MIVHLLDGTYELFRHYYALPSARESPPGNRRRPTTSLSSSERVDISVRTAGFAFANVACPLVSPRGA